MIKIAYHSIYNHPVGDKHKFPMEKYDLLPQQLLYEGLITRANLFSPDEVSLDDLKLIHDIDYIENTHSGSLIPFEWRKIGFQYSPNLILREKVIMGGTIQSAIFALNSGLSFNIAGGTHHAYRDKGEGFCIYNDLALTVAYLKKYHEIDKFLIIDLDVHQGNGTASIFQNDKTVFTFSMHGKNNYPMFKEQSDLDIPLLDGCTDEDYLSLLNNSLSKIKQEFSPDFILYQSGVDILETDKLGKLKISQQGVKERDNMVLSFAKNLQIPLVASMGGGYSDSIKEIIEAHAHLFRLGFEMYS